VGEGKTGRRERKTLKAMEKQMKPAKERPAERNQQQKKKKVGQNS